ncbi:hypothetical protein SAMN06295933_3361 [Desulfovibrio gilichinskyi]|uniref:Uncharacterized protein n=1 Tax=Desulfovibrio gilichinskyi TaxID=1519643 RepID=A0A1X7ET90_9BACT|nr:hypothetical protein SAMN06295933_3361 [Desulfovibrio gilichinskyi]
MKVRFYFLCVKKKDRQILLMTSIDKHYLREKGVIINDKTVNTLSCGEVKKKVYILKRHKKRVGHY